MEQIYLTAADFVAFSLFPCKETLRLGIAGLFGLWIPSDFASQPGGNRREMAYIHRLNMRENVGNRQASLPNAPDKVCLVILELLAVVEFVELFIGERVPNLVLDVFVRFTLDPLTIDVDSSFGSLKENTIAVS